MSKSKTHTFGLLTPSMADAISYTDISLPGSNVIIVKRFVAEMMPQNKNIPAGATFDVGEDPPDEEADTASDTVEDNETETENDILMKI